MTSVEPTGERVVRPIGFDLAEAWKLITDEVDQRRSPLRANALASSEVVWDLRHMFGTRVRIGPTTPDGRVEVELRGQSPWLLAAEIAGFGSLVEVLDPIEVREQLARLASELATTYSASIASPTITG
jgi:predicted DNA-binding transcriptional regulator YafY